MLIARSWPQVKGDRHERAFALGGFLGRANWSVEDIGYFMQTVCDYAGDKEVDDRVRSAKNNAEALNTEGATVYGLPKVRELFGADIADKLAEWSGYGSGGSEQLVALNSKYCVVKAGGKTRVLSFRQEETGRSVPQYETFDDFKNFMLNRFVGKKPLGHWWLGHRDRKQYDGVVYLPGQPEIVNNCYNLWRGFVAIPPKPGNWSLMRKHIKEVLAAGKQEIEDYILNWTAWTLQNPGDPAEVALVFCGGRGTGRGVFARTLCRIFGQHALHISSIEHLVGRFNDQLQDCSLLYADEAYWPGDKRGEGSLKRMITEDTLLIEPKGLGKFTVQNCLHIIMSSNEDWVVPAGMDERRFVVSNVAETYKQQEAWFKPLYKEIEEGGAAAMLYDLLNRDLGDWHPRKIISTEALTEQKLKTITTEMKWWLDVLAEGYLPFGCETSGDCPTAALYEHYTNFVRRSGARYACTQTQLGILLHRTFVPGLQKIEDQKYQFISRGRLLTRKGYVYRLPTLATCRVAFDKLLGRPTVGDKPSAQIWGHPHAEWATSSIDDAHTAQF